MEPLLVNVKKLNQHIITVKLQYLKVKKIIVFTSQLQSTLKLQKFNSYCYEQYPLILNLMVK